MSGFYGGCGPCGGGSSFDSCGANGYNSGFCDDAAQGCYGASSNNIACNTREVYHEKSSNLCASNAACAGSASRCGRTGFANGYNGFGARGANFGGCVPGCGPFVGGCGPRGFRKFY